jgi:hypothetical protein
MRTIEQTLELVKEIYLSVFNDIEFYDEDDKENLFSSVDDTTFRDYELQEITDENNLYSIKD